MAGLTPFDFRPGRSFLHRLDARAKALSIALISIAMMPAKPMSCLIFALVVLIVATNSGIKWGKTLRSIRGFLLLLTFIVLARALSTPGEDLFSFRSLSISREGIFQGSLTAFKFFLIMVTGILFTATTPVSGIKHSAQWFLKPVPFVPEKRVAVMIGLAVRFIPVLLKQARDVSDARKARCSDLRKNPFRKTVHLSLPLLRKTFLAADQLVMAMESRCYSDDRTDPEFTPSGKEAVFLSITLFIALGLIFL